MEEEKQIQTGPDSEYPTKSSKSFWLIVIFGLVLILVNLYFFYTTPVTVSEDEKRDTEEVATVGELADWQTYSNEEYGFEFRYPGDWVISMSLGDLETKENSGHLPFKDLSLYVIPKEKEIGYEEYVKNYDGIGSGFNWVGSDGDLVNIYILNRRFKGQTALSDIVEKSEDKVDGFWVEKIEDLIIGVFNAKRYISRQEWEGGDTEDNAIIEKSDLGDGFLHLTIHYNNGDYRKDVFDQILSTFRFLD